MIRRGREQIVPDSSYAPINVFAMLDALRMLPGETIADVQARLDPERVAEVLGVTVRGEVGGALAYTQGEKLFTNGTLGVDLLVVPPGAGFPPHVHHGHHLLICLVGRGTFTLNREIHEVEPGSIAMIEGSVPHAVGNPFDQPHVLLAIGAPHRELDSADRMTLTDWEGTPLLVEHTAAHSSLAHPAHTHHHGDGDLHHTHAEQPVPA